MNSFSGSLPTPYDNHAREIARDPYPNFLAIHAGYNKRELMNVLIASISQFPMELGLDFALLGRERLLGVGRRGG